MNMSWMTLCWIAFWLAALPYGLAIINIIMFRAPEKTDAKAPPVSILMPARNEEARIRPALETIQQTEGVEFELIVADDSSSDSTPDIVREYARNDERIKLVTTPKLPEGWGGKLHACHFLSTQAKHDHMIFIDADMIVAPDAFARLSSHLAHNRAAMVSGVPFQKTVTFWEQAVIPTIHLLLLGYLPFIGMRNFVTPAFGAAVGQIIAVRRKEYEQVGGHKAIRETMHDGIQIARLFRRNKIMTDLVDVTNLCATRMYEDLKGIWSGFMKNAHEGMATPIGLPIWTLLLVGGHILPVILVVTSFALGLPAMVAVASLLFSYLLRILLAFRFKQSFLGVLVHPLGVGFMVFLQWSALLRRFAGRTVSWRDRDYETK